MTSPDRLHRRAVAAFRRGEASRWVVAHAAAHIVGRNVPGLTLALASDLRVTEDQVQNYAAGYAFYAFLRGHFRPKSEIRRLRRELTLTHFSRLGRLSRNPAFELDPAEWVEYLQTAAENGVSAAGLIKILEDIHKPNAPATWQRPGFVSALRDLEAAPWAPVDVKLAARLITAWLGAEGGEGG